MYKQSSSHEELLQELQRLQRRVAELEAAEEARQESETRSHTERKKAEAELTHTSEVLDKVFANSALGIAILDTAFTFLRVNQAYAAFDGHPPEFYVGKNHFALYPSADNEAIFRRVIETGEPYSVSEKPFVYPTHPERGTSYWDWSLQPLRDKGGTWGLALWLIDVTQRKLGEEAVRRNAAWLNNLITTTQDAFISIDRQGCIVRFNPAAEAIFGYPRAEVEGQKVNLLMPEPYGSEHDGYITRYERTREPHAIGQIRTVSARRKNGEVFPIELSVTEVEADDEVHYGAFIRDISEKIHFQEQLIERERLAAIGTTAATFAHEIGNPLNGMSTNAQLLERRLAKAGDGLDARLASYVSNIRHEVTRLTNLLYEFRSISRRQSFALQSLDLARVIQELLAVETPHYIDRGVQVEFLVPAGLPPVRADGDKLKQVFLNLCKNAVEAMPAGGTLTLRAHAAQEQVNIEVTDTGEGIPEGVHIFEPFVTTKAEGTGLGLSVVQQIITAHGGTLSYTSTSGQGTTFTVVLPLSPPPGALEPLDPMVRASGRAQAAPASRPS